MDYLLNFWKPAIEIAILWSFLYFLLIFIKGTPAVQVLKGLIILIIVFFMAFFVTQKLGLTKISWILPKFFAISLIAFLIVFQPELRRGLAQLGQNPIIGIFLKEEKIVDEIVDAVTFLSKKRIGALIAIEREIGLRPYIESGIPLESRVTSELINTIFMPNTPLHDGGVVIAEGKLQAAGCLFPLTQNPQVSKTLGTRHRAAIGLTEETDAVAVIVSEETGAMSISIGGRLTRNLDNDVLTKVLNKLYKRRARRTVFDYWKR